MLCFIDHKRERMRLTDTTTAMDLKKKKLAEYNYKLGQEEFKKPPDRL